MEIIAYIASALIGISLGLIGGGGSMLTVPVLVYLFGVTPLLATSYSLFVVGTTSLIGAFQNYRHRLVDVKTALLFSLSSITTVFLIRMFLVPVLPANLFSIGGLQVQLNVVTMLLFAVLMVAASFSMIRDKQNFAAEVQTTSDPAGKMLIYGIGIGVVTGFLGAGGGFLLIPTLVMRLKLPMKVAIGTSLAIIAMNSLIGFIGDLGHFNINWFFLLTVTALAISGVFLGTFLSAKLDGTKLKKGFGWFVLLMGSYILLKELLG